MPHACHKLVFYSGYLGLFQAVKARPQFSCSRRFEIQNYLLSKGRGKPNLCQVEAEFVRETWVSTKKGLARLCAGVAGECSRAGGGVGCGWQLAVPAEGPGQECRGLSAQSRSAPERGLRRQGGQGRLCGSKAFLFLCVSDLAAAREKASCLEGWPATASVADSMLATALWCLSHIPYFRRALFALGDRSNP